MKNTHRLTLTALAVSAFSLCAFAEGDIARKEELENKMSVQTKTFVVVVWDAELNDWKLQLTQNVDHSLSFYDDMGAIVLDMNNFSVTGIDGEDGDATTNGGNGAPGIYIEASSSSAAPTVMTIVNGSVYGGNGGNGRDCGKGGLALDYSSVNLIEGVELIASTGAIAQDGFDGEFIGSYHLVHDIFAEYYSEEAIHIDNNAEDGGWNVYLSEECNETWVIPDNLGKISVYFDLSGNFSSDYVLYGPCGAEGGTNNTNERFDFNGESGEPAIIFVHGEEYDEEYGVTELHLNVIGNSFVYVSGGDGGMGGYSDNMPGNGGDGAPCIWIEDVDVVDPNVSVSVGPSIDVCGGSGGDGVNGGNGGNGGEAIYANVKSNEGAIDGGWGGNGASGLRAGEGGNGAPAVVGNVFYNNGFIYGGCGGNGGDAQTGFGGCGGMGAPAIIGEVIEEGEDSDIGDGDDGEAGADGRGGALRLLIK